MKTPLIAGLGLFAIAACAPMEGTTPDPMPPQDGQAQCKADQYQSWIGGSHVGAVTFAPGANVRIVCTTCAATDDYRPDRMNVRFDQATGIIRAVDCG